MRLNPTHIRKGILVSILMILFGNAITLFELPLREFTWRILLSNSLYALIIGGAMALGIFRIIAWLDRKYPWLQNPGKRIVYQLVFTIGYCLGVVALFILIFAWFNRERITDEILVSNVMFMVKVTLFFLILSMLITNAILFFVNWKKSAVVQEQLKREQLDLQYETLKNQVNPHFLFNSLNAITSLIKKEPDKAIEFTRKLSEVYRYVLEQRDNEIVPVERETKFLESYVFLQKIRFGKNLKVTVEVGERDRYIIPLSLQMLVENAIKHNIVSAEFPLHVEIFSENGEYLVVRNNVKKKPSGKSSGIGLENIRSRYEFFTSKPVVVENDEKSFVVKIPMISEGLND
jgi:LytS/YehU family sensor histidine kinase